MENNPITLKVITQTLRSQGYILYEANDARTALDIFKKTPPDLILQDIRLPDLDGYELCRQIRESPGGRELPIIAITDLEHACVSTALFSAHVQKPIDPSQLICEVSGSITKVVSRVSPRRVLVVHDNPSQLRLLALLLKKDGYLIETATGGEEALAAIRRLPPDAVISDVLMPRIDGFTFCAMMKKDPLFSKIPVILTSNAFIESEDRRIADGVGAIALLASTPSQHEILETLRTWWANPPRLGTIASPAVTEAQRLKRLSEMTLSRVRRISHMEGVLSVITAIDVGVHADKTSKALMEELLPPLVDALGLHRGAVCFLKADLPPKFIALTGFHRDDIAELLEIAASHEVTEALSRGENALQVSGNTGSCAYVVAQISGTSQTQAGLIFLDITGLEDQYEWLTPASFLGREICRILACASELSQKMEVTERLRQVTDSINEVFWMIDPNYTKMLYISSAYERIWGRSCTEMYKNARAWIEGIFPEDRAKVFASLDALRLREHEMKFRIVRADGMIRWILSCAYPVRNDKGEVIAVAGTAQDITERQHMEEELRQAQKMEAVGQLAGGVAHDFNNLLAVILGSTEVLLDELPASDPRRGLANEIRSATESAAALTRQLLAFGRKQMLAPKTIRLCNVVRDVEKMLMRLLPENIRITIVGCTDYLWVHADPAQMEQIIINLAVNARDSMPSGGELTIELSRVTLDETYTDLHSNVKPGDYVCLTMSDTGTGMDDQTRTHIFEPFFTTKKPGQGTGLGLATVYGIVKQSNGFIMVYSEPGHGSAFKIYLPCAEAGVPAQLAPKPDHPVAATTGQTILLAEDNAGVRRAARRILEHGGYRVIEAADGNEALRISEASSETFDLVMTDVVMPGLGGPELADRLRKNSPNLRVLFMSGYTEAGVQQRGLFDGTFDFIEKPFSREGLLKKLREIFARDAVF